MGNNGYDWQTYLTWFPIEYNDPTSRFPVPDGSVGLISPHQPQPGSIVGGPLPGQVPLHRWSTRKGFYYSVYYSDHAGSEYVYGGVAGYVWPAGDIRGFPLYQFYSHEYGHYYTNYKSEIDCQPNVQWDDQGEMARVNWPAPAFQAFRNCGSSFTFPVPCDPFAKFRCEGRGGVYNTGICLCSDGLP
jgi:hypothetical protein